MEPEPTVSNVLAGDSAIVRAYAQAQRGIAELKAAVFTVVASSGTRGITNAEVGRSLGVYGGHVGHEGHISRSVLELLKTDGVVQQSPASKRWYSVSHQNVEQLD